MGTTSRRSSAADCESEARECVLQQHQEALTAVERLRRGLRNERSRERYREKVGQAKQGQCTASTAPPGTASQQPTAFTDSDIDQGSSQ